MVRVYEELSRDAVAGRLRQARIAAKFNTAAEAARALGMKEVTVRAHENAQNGLSPGNAKKYARAYGVSADWLLYGETPLATAPKTFENGLVRYIERSAQDARYGIPRRIPVVGEVNAGVFKEPKAFTGEDAVQFLNIQVSGYEAARPFALRVVGPSMNEHYPDGRLIICAPVGEVGLREGDHVIVQRNKAGLVETTCKELRPIEGGVALIPKSDHPDHQEPLIIRTNDEDQDAPQVTGVVIADYQKRDRSSPPIRVPGVEIAEDW